MDLLTTYPLQDTWQGVVLFIWIALSVGSFLNVVIYRLPVMLEREWAEQARSILGLQTAPESEQDPDPELDQVEEPADKFNLMVPRSRCPKCNHQITALENIPVLSWVFLRGKCSSCETAISFRYPAIELLTALLSVVVIMTFGFTSIGLFACLFTWMLVALTFIDFDTTLLPDQITYPLLWLGLIANGFFTGIVGIEDALIGAIAGYLFLWGTYWAFKLLTGKEGMGYGDFKLLAALGAWLGWQALSSVVLISAVVGLLFAMARIFSKRQASSEPIPFGPFLAIAGWVTLVFRDNVLGVFLL